MKNNDKHRKMLSVSKKLLSENDLDFTWYINRCNGRDVNTQWSYKRNIHSR